MGDNHLSLNSLKNQSISVIFNIRLEKRLDLKPKALARQDLIKFSVEFSPSVSNLAWLPIKIPPTIPPSGGEITL